MKISIKAMAITVVAIFAVGIGLANLTGFWRTTSTKIPVKISEGEFAGMPDPADIRGSYTWADLGRAFNFDSQLAMRAFGSNDSAEKVNTLEAKYGEAGLPEGTEIGTGSVRLFVSLLLGLPYDAEEGTILPASAIEVLREYGKADPALIDDAASKAFAGEAVAEAAEGPESAPAGEAASPAAPAEAKKTADAAPVTTTPVTTVPAAKAPTVPAATPAATAPAATPAATAPAATPAATAPASTTTSVPAPASSEKSASESTEDHAPPAGTVTGKTTFKDLLNAGITAEAIKSVTDGKIGPDSAVIKDWAAANGLTFSELKTKLQELFPKQ